jgi:metal-responsive CopG/Arc/MetJ family transcriptional regulator
MMRTLIDIPEEDLKAIKKITNNRSDFVRKAIRLSLQQQQAPAPDISRFFGMFPEIAEDGMAFQDRMRSEW